MFDNDTNGGSEGQLPADDGGSVARRDVLRATSAVGMGALAAGTGTVGASESDAEYVAGPVGLDEETKAEYRLLDHERAVAETEAGVTYESTTAAYGGGPPFFGLFGTPDLESEGHEPSIPVRASLEEFLATDAGLRLLAMLNVGGEVLEWTETPDAFAENLGETEPILLDEEAEMVSLVGVVNEDQALLAHVGRVHHEGDVVFAVDTRVRQRENPEQPLLGGEEAVYPERLQPQWCDMFNERVRKALRHKPIPSCLSPIHDLGVAHVEITHPPHKETIRYDRNNEGQAKMMQSGETYEISDGGQSVVIDPEAAVSGCYEELRWTYKSFIPTCSDYYGVQDGGSGKSTNIELFTCGCSGSRYWIKVEALDAQGDVIASDIHSIVVDLLRC